MVLGIYNTPLCMYRCVQVKDNSALTKLLMPRFQYLGCSFSSATPSTYYCNGYYPTAQQSGPLDFYIQNNAELEEFAAPRFQSIGYGSLSSGSGNYYNNLRLSNNPKLAKLDLGTQQTGVSSIGYLFVHSNKMLKSADICNLVSSSRGQQVPSSYCSTGSSCPMYGPTNTYGTQCN